MSFRLFPVVIVWLGLLIPARADEPNPKELLEKSQQALRLIKAVAYDAVWTSEGSIAGLLPSQTGHVLLARSDSPLLKMRADTWTTAPDGRMAIAAEMISNGKTVASITHSRQQYKELTGPGAGGEVLRWKGIVLEQLLRGQIYEKELASDAAKYIGSETVDGVDCYVVEGVNPDAPVTTRWSLGKQDLFPRRLVRVIGTPPGQETENAVQPGRGELTLNSFTPNPKFGDKTFTFSQPEGYSERGAQLGTGLRVAPWDVPYLPIGSEAPDWSLRTPDGKNVALKDLRGKVVVLSFWASWAAPCQKALPALQKLRDAYKDRPVALYLVDAFERHADPAKALEAAGLSQSLLLDGDEVAAQYHVLGIPTFYLVSPEGKVLFVEGGVLHEDSVKSMIDSALAGATASRPASAPTVP
jgi:peroxiredoxin